jgi:hypothetical protein
MALEMDDLRFHEGYFTKRDLLCEVGRELLEGILPYPFRQ